MLLISATKDEDGVECMSLVRPVRMLRDPMPWEGEYFDPSYHKWPKSSGSSKITNDDGNGRAKRFVSKETMYGGDT